MGLGTRLHTETQSAYTVQKVDSIDDEFDLTPVPSRVMLDQLSVEELLLILKLL